MGNTDSVQKVSFEDIKFIIKNNTSFNIINTLQKSSFDGGRHMTRINDLNIT